MNWLRSFWCHIVGHRPDVFTASWTMKRYNRGRVRIEPCRSRHRSCARYGEDLQ